ncbi:hypothetical protein PRIPAC_85855 [Pristionchus pacificus]|nr:hypothetical protein PRIPAC_85855 [Pristionchus pacificus]|eukprot:PDM68709.1 hypothetical protein PRIPAC_47011 [Pristionchus pacificus]
MHWDGHGVVAVCEEGGDDSRVHQGGRRLGTVPQRGATHGRAHARQDGRVHQGTCKGERVTKMK